MNIGELKDFAEAILLISGDGMTPAEIAKAIDSDVEQVRMILDSLVDDYSEKDGGVTISQVRGRYIFTTSLKLNDKIREYTKSTKTQGLSKNMLETLAIITYKQPITLTEIDDVRGVNSRSMTIGLIDRKLVKSMGHKEALGRPTLYGTTKEFLHYLGINSLEDLPSPSEVKELNFDEL